VCWKLLKDSDLVSVHEENIIIYSEEEDECEEEGHSGEEMPHVVIVEEVHDITKLVPVPGLCRGTVTALVTSGIEGHSDNTKDQGQQEEEEAREAESPAETTVQLTLLRLDCLFQFKNGVVR